MVARCVCLHVALIVVTVMASDMCVVVHVRDVEYCRCFQGFECREPECRRYFTPDQTWTEIFEYPTSCTACRCAPIEETEPPEPPMFEKWTEFAAQHGCDADSRVWSRVDEQMAQFRRIGITQQMMSDAEALPRTRTCSTGDLNVCWPDDVREILSRVVPYLSAELRLVFNELDEPRVLAPSREFAYKLDVHLFQTLRPTNVEAMRVLCAHHPALSATNEGHSFLFRPATIAFTFSLVPVFGNAAMPGCFADIAVPTGYGDGLREEEPRGLDKVPWSSKIDKVFWRGTSSGSMHLKTDYNLNFIRHRHREHIYRVLKDDAQDYDIGIVDWLQCDSDALCAYLARSVGTVARVPLEHFPRYRYLLDMDGNSFSQRFVFLLRHTQSLVLKMSLFDQWETLLTTPMKHFVPVAFNTESLARALQWARQHQREAEDIAIAGREFALARLRKDDAACYWFRVLMYYEQARMKGRRRDEEREQFIQKHVP